MIDEVDTNGDGAVDFEGISFHIHINSQRSHNLCFVPEFVAFMQGVGVAGAKIY